MRKFVMAIMISSLVACSYVEKQKYLGYWKEEQIHDKSSRRSKERKDRVLHIYKSHGDYLHDNGAYLEWNSNEGIFQWMGTRYVYSAELNQITEIDDGEATVYKKISQ